MRKFALAAFALLFLAEATAAAFAQNSTRTCTTKCERNSDGSRTCTRSCY